MTKVGTGENIKINERYPKMAIMYFLERPTQPKYQIYNMAAILGLFLALKGIGGRRPGEGQNRVFCCF